MKKTYLLDEIDCPNCAAKLENAIKKVEGVENATVNFFAQKLIVEAEDSQFDTVMEKVFQVIKKMEPDCEVK